MKNMDNIFYIGPEPEFIWTQANQTLCDIWVWWWRDNSFISSNTPTPSSAYLAICCWAALSLLFIVCTQRGWDLKIKFQNLEFPLTFFCHIKKRTGNWMYHVGNLNPWFFLTRSLICYSSHADIIVFLCLLVKTESNIWTSRWTSVSCEGKPYVLLPCKAVFSAKLRILTTSGW